jgi:hypothetical protein
MGVGAGDDAGDEQLADGRVLVSGLTGGRMSEDEADAAFVELDVDVMGSVEAGEGGGSDCGDPGLGRQHGPQHEQPGDEMRQAAELREWPGDRHGQWKGTGGKGRTF